MNEVEATKNPFEWLFEKLNKQGLNIQNLEPSSIKEWFALDFDLRNKNIKKSVTFKCKHLKDEGVFIVDCDVIVNVDVYNKDMISKKHLKYILSKSTDFELVKYVLKDDLLIARLEFIVNEQDNFDYLLEVITLFLEQVKEVEEKLLKMNLKTITLN